MSKNTYDENDEQIHIISMLWNEYTDCLRIRVCLSVHGYVFVWHHLRNWPVLLGTFGILISKVHLKIQWRKNNCVDIDKNVLSSFVYLNQVSARKKKPNGNSFYYNLNAQIVIVSPSLSLQFLWRWREEIVIFSFRFVSLFAFSHFIDLNSLN